MACFTESLALFHSLADRRGIAYSLAGVAATIVFARRPSRKTNERATRLFAAGDALLVASRIRMAPVDADAFERSVDALRARMNETEFGDAWAAGRTMPLDKAIAEVLARTHRQRMKAAHAETDSGKS
jgi:hypothetical protein